MQGLCCVVPVMVGVPVYPVRCSVTSFEAKAVGIRL